MIMKLSLANNSNSEFHVITILSLYNCKWKYPITAIYTPILYCHTMLNKH